MQFNICIYDKIYRAQGINNIRLYGYNLTVFTVDFLLFINMVHLRILTFGLHIL